MNFIRTGVLLAALTAFFGFIGFLIGGTGGMLIALAIAVGMNFYAYWNSDKAALRQHGARLVTMQSEPELVTMVAQLAKNANLPMPRVFIIDTDQPNAFATGRNPQNAAVAATTGLMSRLTQEELAGVMAHELAHVKNRDTLTMTITASIAGAISMLANFAMFFRGGNNRSNIFVMLAVSFLAPMAAGIVQMAISRTREYAADKMGGEICENPIWLADALVKIQQFSQSIPNERAEANPASAHLFIINPLTGGGRDKLFSTHPNTQNRVEALEKQHAAMYGDTHQSTARSNSRQGPKIW